MKRFIFAVLALCHIGLVHADPAPIPQIRQIPVPYLQDVAMASFDGMGPVIYYNPYIIDQSPPLLRKFFLLHETGHHVLNHIQQSMFTYDPYSRAWVQQDLEKQADCYAAKNLSAPERQMIAQWFAMTQGLMRPDWFHPTGYERAQVLLTCQ